MSPFQELSPTWPLLLKQACWPLQALSPTSPLLSLQAPPLHEPSLTDPLLLKQVKLPLQEPFPTGPLFLSHAKSPLQELSPTSARSPVQASSPWQEFSPILRCAHATSALEPVAATPSARTGMVSVITIPNARRVIIKRPPLGALCTLSLATAHHPRRPSSDQLPGGEGQPWRCRPLHLDHRELWQLGEGIHRWSGRPSVNEADWLPLDRGKPGRSRATYNPPAPFVAQRRAGVNGVLRLLDSNRAPGSLVLGGTGKPSLQGLHRRCRSGAYKTNYQREVDHA